MCCVHIVLPGTHPQTHSPVPLVCWQSLVRPERPDRSQVTRLDQRTGTSCLHSPWGTLPTCSGTPTTSRSARAGGWLDPAVTRHPGPIWKAETNGQHCPTNISTYETTYFRIPGTPTVANVGRLFCYLLFPPFCLPLLLYLQLPWMQSGPLVNLHFFYFQLCLALPR